MRRFRTIPVLSALLLVAATLVLLGGPTANAATGDVWAPADQAAIHPGVQMFTEGAQCTANFVYADDGGDGRVDPGDAVYLGYAAHCAGLGAATDTDGCLAESLPTEATKVTIAGSDGNDYIGTLVYSSWETMQDQGGASSLQCAYNDLALVRVADADVDVVNPTVPHWGGPTGLNTTGNPAGSVVYSYGNSELRFGLGLLSPKEGLSLGTTPDGWSHPVYTLTPGVPGDSGSGLLDAQGQASGVLSTLALAPLPASNNFGDLAHELAYMQAQDPAMADVQLQLGTVHFDGSALPLGL